MKEFVFKVDELLPKLGIVAGVLANKNVMPTLNCARFDISASNVATITTSDNVTWVSVKQDVETKSEQDFSFCVSCKDLLQTLKNLTGREVVITLNEEKNILQASHISGNFTLPYENAENFPPAKYEEGAAHRFNISAQRLANAVADVEYAVCSDEVHIVMCSIHFDVENNHVITVASDGLKLVRYTQDIAENIEEPFSFNLPKKPAHLLPTLLNGNEGFVQVVCTKTTLGIKAETFTLSTRLQDGKYPNYNRVIPVKDTCTHNYFVDKGAICDALKRLLPLGNAATPLVVVSFKGSELTLTTENTDYSKSAKEHLTCTAPNEEDFVIGFNGAFLLQALSNVQDNNVALSCIDSNRAALICPQNQAQGIDYTSILMPLLIKL